MESRRERGEGGEGKYSAKRETSEKERLRRSTRGTKTTDYKCLSGTYVGPPGADPLGGAPDIRHRKPREIVPQVSADASIKTRWCYYSGASFSIIFVRLLSLARFSVSLFFASRSPRNVSQFPLYISCPDSSGTRNRARPFLFLSACAARISARPKLPTTRSLSLSACSPPSSRDQGQPFHGLNQSRISEKWLRPCRRYGKQLVACIIYGEA